MTTSTSGAFAALTVVVCLLAPGCAPEPLGSAPQLECNGPHCSEVNACDGEDPAAFCDDCNPCTVDVNCTPCSALAPSERSVHTCTPDDELSVACGEERGCAHAPLTTPVAQINACFPVMDDPDLHAGVCFTGTCIDEADR